jgi:putative N6-adenine-specific DNA methylase
VRFFAAALPGVEALLATELDVLVARGGRVVPGGVELEGDDRTLYRIALGSGLASGLSLRVGAFRARRFEALLRETAALPWNELLPENAPFEVRARCRKSRLHHSGAVEERVARAITEARGAGDPSEAAVEIACRVFHDEVTLSVDVTGDPLSKRGYRQATGKAPLREDLARALLVLSGWSPGAPLLDPFCGSGTIVIEGARMALGRLPGADRSFAFERAPFFDRERFDEERQRLGERFAKDARAPIVHGSDRDEGAVKSARENAERAGVAEVIALSHAPLGKAPFFEAPPTVDPASGPGALVTNPPHGKRVGDPKTLKRLYQSLGAKIARLGGAYRVALLVRDARIARAVGVPLDTLLVTDQGGDKVRVLVGDASGTADAGDE